MTNDLTLESARNLTDIQLLAAIASALSEAADGLLCACVAVSVAKERGIELPMLPDVFRYALEVADGRLSARAAMTLARYPFVIRAVMNVDHAMQERLADGEKIKIAVRINGHIQSAERSIWEMSQMQMRVAFTDGKITPWEQQGEWLHKSGHVDPVKGSKRAKIKTNPIAQELVVTSGRISIDDLRSALLPMGLQIIEVYKGKKITVAKGAMA